MGACRPWTNADNRLPLIPRGRLEGADGIIEGRDVADVCPQPSVTHPPDHLSQLGTDGDRNESIEAIRYGTDVGAKLPGRPPGRGRDLSERKRAKPKLRQRRLIKSA